MYNFMQIFLHFKLRPFRQNSPSPSTIPSNFTLTFHHSVKIHLHLPPFRQISPSPSTIPSNSTFTFHHSVLQFQPSTIPSTFQPSNLPTFKHFNLPPVRQISHRQQQHHLHQNDQLCKHCHRQFNAIVIIINNGHHRHHRHNCHH